MGLQPLTSGSTSSARLPAFLTDDEDSVHGYSLLRTQLNSDYFHDIFNETAKFEVPLEGHREFIRVLIFIILELIAIIQILRRALAYTRPLLHIHLLCVWPTMRFYSSSLSRA